MNDTISPALKRKATHLATRETSFAAAADSVKELLDLHINAKRVERLAEAQGELRVAERRMSVAEWAAKTLVEKEKAPPGVKAPQVVCVSCDGGRVQRCDLPETAASHWTETKVGILEELKPQTHTCDPCPQIPTKFLDVAEMDKVTREIKRAVPKGQVFTKGKLSVTHDGTCPDRADENSANHGTDGTLLEKLLPALVAVPVAEDPVADARVVAVPPEVLGRDVVASLAGSHGERLALH